MTAELTELERWYANHCNGDWEHQEGIEITTLDNPGWRLIINLADTELEGERFETVEEDYDHETAWLRCWVENGKFQAAGGPLELSRMLRIFLDWAARHSSRSNPPSNGR